GKPPGLDHDAGSIASTIPGTDLEGGNLPSGHLSGGFPRQPGGSTPGPKPPRGNLTPPVPDPDHGVGDLARTVPGTDGGAGSLAPPIPGMRHHPAPYESGGRSRRSPMQSQARSSPELPDDRLLLLDRLGTLGQCS